MKLRGICLGLMVALMSGTAPAAGPVYWDWPSGQTFDQLELSGAAVDEQGRLLPGLAVTPVDLAGLEVVWRVVADDQGGFYLGTGHDGAVHHVDRDGGTRLVAELAAPEVFSLLPVADGAVLAGCGPEGHLVRIAPDGETETLGEVEGGYIWALARRPGTDEIWLATGTPAVVYRYRPEAAALEEMRVLPAENALDLRFTSAAELLVCTQGPGLVYTLDPEEPQAATLLGEVAQDEARQFVSGPGGALHVLGLAPREPGARNGVGGGNGGAEPRDKSETKVAPASALLPLLGASARASIPAAALYRVDTARGLEVIWTGELDLMTVAHHPRWGWLAGGALAAGDGHGGGTGASGTGSRLHRLTPPAGQHPVAGWPGGDVLDLLVGGTGDEAWLAAAQAHPGGLALGDGRSDHDLMALSPPLDGGAPVRWGRMRWEGMSGQGRLRWAVRGGNRAQPDESWTAWSDAWSAEDQTLDLPISRYLQWRVVFPHNGRGRPWRVARVSISAWQDNRPPVIEDFMQEKLQGLQLGGMMNGGPPLIQSFRSGLQVEINRQPSADDWPGPERTELGRSLQVFSWQVNDPDGDRLEFSLEHRRVGEEDWRAVRLADEGPFPFTGSVGSWDTVEVPDGRYEVRLTATDQRDNPAGLAATAARVLGPVTVDNTPPEIDDLKLTRSEAGFVIRCTAADAGSVLAGARVFLPDGRVQRLDPVDRVCDSRRETFRVPIMWPPVGGAAGAEPWRVRIEVRDLRGNRQTSEGVVR